jgi:Lactate racemase N-terminal domain
MSAIDRLLQDVSIPKVLRVRQIFERPKVKDAAAELTRKLRQSGVLSLAQSGQRIAVAVGSRGITSLPSMVRTVVAELKNVGAEPFILPAMGSHGGATAEGQREMLIGTGIAENYVGAPIRATMEVVQVGSTENNLPAYVDRCAVEADAIVIINRIKPHVSFRGPYESGLMKMIAIGLGKQVGADFCHRLGFGRMAENIPAIGRTVLARTNILFAVGLIENAYHETCRIDVLRKDEIEAQEPPLLEQARQLAPRLHFDALDVLIIDEIGKDISGTGFDTNMVGRYHTFFASGGPNITRMAALDITDASHGNGNGLGILDFTTQRAYEKFSFEQSYPNSLTSTVPTSVKIPMVLKNDRQAIQACIKTCNILEWSKVRLARIKNTNTIGEIEVSESLLDEVEEHPHLETLGDPYDLIFDADGNLF